MLSETSSPGYDYIKFMLPQKYVERPKPLTLGALLGPPGSIPEEYQKRQGPLRSPGGPVEAHQSNHTLVSIPAEYTPMEIVKMSSRSHM